MPKLCQWEARRLLQSRFAASPVTMLNVGGGNRWRHFCGGRLWATWLPAPWTWWPTDRADGRAEPAEIAVSKQVWHHLKPLPGPPRLTPVLVPHSGFVTFHTGLAPVSVTVPLICALAVIYFIIQNHPCNMRHPEHTVNSLWMRSESVQFTPISCGWRNAGHSPGTGESLKTQKGQVLDLALPLDWQWFGTSPLVSLITFNTIELNTLMLLFSVSLRRYFVILWCEREKANVCEHPNTGLCISV